MRFMYLLVSLLFVSSMGVTRICAQVVQLPSQHNFSMSGSVLVPDGGTASLGGIGYSRQGSAQSGFGPLSNRSSGSSVGGASLSVSAQIIDLDALDEAILAGASAQTNSPTTDRPGPAASPSSDATGSLAARAKSTGSRSLSSSVAADARNLSPNTSEQVGADRGKWQRVLSGEGSPSAVNESLQESNVRYYVQLGERAERAGSYQAARVYYRLARQAMTPELMERYQRTITNRTTAAARATAQQEDARRKF